MADLEFYKLSMTGAEADSGIRTGMEAGATNGVLLGDGDGGVSAATPGRDFGFPLLTGNGPPTGNTAANIGQHYFDMRATKAPYEYICVGINSNGFIWIVFGDTGDGFKISGYFASLEALEAAISTGTVAAPAAGTAYGIGAAPPYDIYVWDAINSTWLNNGPLGGGGGSGVPPHGDAGQVLVKLTDADYDVGWRDAVPDGSVTSAKLANGSVTAVKLAPNAIPGALGFNPGMVNPNLLDNWYFGNPVNQRGQTVYSGNTYTIDRWRMWRAELSVALAEDGLKLSNASTDSQQFVQYLDAEETARLSGQTATLSILMASGNLYYVTGVLGQLVSVDASMNARENCHVLMSVGNGGLIAVSIYCRANKTSNAIMAVKLELGENQTLARQVNGEWVLNELPNYAEQLARCQRYFRVFQSMSNVAYGLQAGDAYLTSFALSPPMRVAPSLASSSAWIFGSGNGWQQASLGLYLPTPSGFSLTIAHAGIVGGATYLARIDEMVLSADL